MYNGYIATARVNVTKENHARIRDFIAAEFAKCAMGRPYLVLLVNSKQATRNYSCTTIITDLAGHFAEHAKFSGFKNAYPGHAAPWAIWKGSDIAPPLGKTYLIGNNARNRLIIATNVGTASGGNDYLRNTIFKE